MTDIENLQKLVRTSKPILGIRRILKTNCSLWFTTPTGVRYLERKGFEVKDPSAMRVLFGVSPRRLGETLGRGEKTVNFVGFK